MVIYPIPFKETSPKIRISPIKVWVASCSRGDWLLFGWFFFQWDHLHLALSLVFYGLSLGGYPQPSSILIGFSIINQLFGVSPWKSSMVGVPLTSELEVPKGFWSKTSDGSPPLRASGCRTGSPYRLALFGHWQLGCGRFGISFCLFWWTVLQHVDIFELNTLKHSWTLNRLRNDLEHETSEFNHQRQRFSRWTRRCIWGSAATCTSWGAESRGWASSQRRWLLWPLDMHRSGICWWLFVYTPYVCWILLMFAWLVYLDICPQPMIPIYPDRRLGFLSWKRLCRSVGFLVFFWMDMDMVSLLQMGHDRTFLVDITPGFADVFKSTAAGHPKLGHRPSFCRGCWPVEFWVPVV